MLPDTATKHHAQAVSSTTPPPLFSSARLHPPSQNNIPAMGQAESTPRHQPELSALGQGPAPGPGPLLPHPPPSPSPQPASKYRFGWPGRRKKSEDLTKFMTATAPSSSSPVPSVAPPPSSMNNTSKGRELARQVSNVSSSVESHHGLPLPPPMSMHELSRPPSRASSAKQLTLQFASNTLSALKGKLNASQASIHSLKTPVPVASEPMSPPPPLPPKPDLSRYSLSSSSSRSSSSQGENSSGDWVIPERNSKPLPSPMPPTHTTPDASALGAREVETGTQIRHRDTVLVPTATVSQSPSEHLPVGHDVNQPQPQRRERISSSAQTAKDIADDWRKSDSTLRTVRLVGSRTPRPLSLAESTNSGHTVLPGSAAGNMNLAAGKRLSALMTDVDFGLKEVDSEEDEDDEDVDVERSAFVSSPPSAFNSVHSFQQQASSPSSSRSASPASTSGSKPQAGPRRGSLSIRIGRLAGSKARASEHGQLNEGGGSDSEALSSSVSTRGTGTTGMFTANSSTTSITSSPGAKDSRPSIEIASSADIASTMSAEQRPLQYAQYKANAKLEPWVSLPPTNHPASESQASLSTSESASASASSHTGSPSRGTDTERSAKQTTTTTMPTSPPHSSTLRPAHQRTRLQSIQARGFRQTAVSLTTGLAPAAGFARKAVDRLGRALGGSSGSLADEGSTPTPTVPGGQGNAYGHVPSASGSNSALFGTTGYVHQQQQQQGQQQQQQGHRRQHQHPHPAHGQFPPSSAKKAMRKKHGASSSGTWSVNSTSTSDTDGTAAGPNLGRCLRGPLMPPNNGIGLVFGRELELCVKDTACIGPIESGVDSLALEGRNLPALVVRCAQHIVKWGVQEEGLFRISGRSTHISKLRAEFDSGADYDLSECGPGEIDPHAVSSIFKAYLRELPEPLLTRQLMPYFEAALAAENSLINAADLNHNGFERGARGPGLPSSPRDSIQVRKAPSLSTFAVPTLSPHTASQPLLNTLSALIARLPKENCDLIRTVTELIMKTARASRETKMPLSNLLLVFCPSLMMSPPLLRVLCEGQGIWDGPLEVGPGDGRIVAVRGGSGEVVDRENDPDEKDEDEEDGDGSSSGEGLHHQGTIRRPPRSSTEAKPDSNEDASETAAPVAPPTSPPHLVLPSDDGETSGASSYTKTDSSISASINLSSPDGLTHSSSSSDSLHTPPSSSPGSVSPNEASLAPCASSSMTKPALDTTGLGNKIMALRGQSDLPSPLSPSAVKKVVRKSLIGNPLPFPLALGMNRSASGCSAPVTPIELRGSASDKLSLTTSHSSSSPNLVRDGLGLAGSGSAGNGNTPPQLGRRKSKASLLGLKSKRSLSSLLGFAQTQTQTQEQSLTRPLRTVVPGLAVEELPPPPPPPPRSSTPCPVLDLPVDTSRIQLGDGLGLGLGLGLSLTNELESHRPNEVPSTLRIRSPSPSPSPSRPPSPSPVRTLGTSMMMDRAESDSSAMTNSVFYTPPTTTRALLAAPTPAGNTSTSTSLPVSTSSSSSTSTNSTSGSYTFLEFNLGKSGEDDDWAKSVLQAAASDA